MHISALTESPVAKETKHFSLEASKAGRLLKNMLLVFIALVAWHSNSITNAQNAPVVAVPPSHEVAVDVNSGLVGNTAANRQVVFQEAVEVDGAKWIQLEFSDVVLTTGHKETSILRITSLEDGAVQILNPTTCEQWRHKSAYFNGDAVEVELLAHAAAEKNCVVIERVIAGDVPDLSPTESICDAVDDRVLSNDPRLGRIDVGCTAWLFDGRENDLITAGHCAPSMSTVFFNVPLSDADGSINFPPPEDQYAICTDSIQFLNAGVGSDWCYFGVFNNSNTGLSPLAAQGDSFSIGIPDSNTFESNDLIRVTGFGSTNSPVNPRWNLALKTHVGSFEGLVGNVLRYRPDTTGGNSGSPVIDDFTGIAYGVHTHGGCSINGGFNQGTGFHRPDFLSAINNPQGACTPATAPSNDDCDAALLIGDGTEEFNTTAATTDGPTLPEDCRVGSFALSLVNDIWFEYEASCTGEATFDFCASSYDTRVAAYSLDTGCPGTLLGCNDDSCGLQSEMTIDVIEGESYLIRVGGFSGGGIGSMTVTCAASDAPIDVDSDDGIMIIDGTQGPDDINVSQLPGSLEIVVNGQRIGSASLMDVDVIIINGYGGADLIQVDASIPTVINGGFGADVILGGDRPGMLFGGPGPDLIYGGPSDDFIDAGIGNDTVFGYAGADEILGGSGDDTLNGGAGDDELYGGRGGDTISGGSGNDLLVGNVGADKLNGGGGDDELIGLGGPDEMFGGPGNDEFFGGEGFDTIDGGSGIDTSLDNGEFEIRIESD
jgi:Ca2+-binding RTX toxin-like protein